MVLDWALASLHYLAILTLASTLAFELAITATEIDSRAIMRLARVDAWYGVMAAVVLATGLARVLLGLEGPSYYVANAFFWTKIALFVAIGALLLIAIGMVFLQLKGDFHCLIE